MTRRELAATALLAILGELALLGVFVFIDEPHQVGLSAPRMHALDAAYIALPLLLLAAAAAFVPLRALRRSSRRERA